MKRTDGMTDGGKMGKKKEAYMRSSGGDIMFENWTGPPEGRKHVGTTRYAEHRLSARKSDGKVCHQMDCQKNEHKIKT